MCVPDRSDGDLLDDRGHAATHHFHDPHGHFQNGLYKLSNFQGGPPSSGPDVNRRSGGQLSQRHQLHGRFSPLDHFFDVAPPLVPGRLDHGHCSGALRVAQQGGLEDNHDGGLLPGQTDARLHVHHHVPLNVDFQYSHNCHDVADC